MAKPTSTRNSNTWETGTCKRPEQEAQRLRPGGSGPEAKASPRAAVNCHGKARTNRPCAVLGAVLAAHELKHARAGRSHSKGTRWHGLLLCMMNTPSLRVTAAPRGERQICPVGRSRGVGFAHLGLRTAIRRLLLISKSPLAGYFLPVNDEGATCTMSVCDLRNVSKHATGHTAWVRRAPRRLSSCDAC